MIPLRVVRWAGFLAWYASEVVATNLRLAAALVRRHPGLSPGLLVIRLEPLTDRQLFLLCALTTMTPGTLAVELSADRRQLLLHTLDLSAGAEAFQRAFKGGLERRVRDVF